MRISKSFHTADLVIAALFLTLQIAACNDKNSSGGFKSDHQKKKTDVLWLEKTIDLPGIRGRVDHMAIDVKDQILFIAALGNNSIEAVDLTKGIIINSIKDIDEPQGVIFVPDNNTICISSGGSGVCNFYDAKTFSIQSSVDIGPDADNLRYNPIDKLIFAGYGEGGIAVLDAIKQTLISKITFDGHPEAFQLEKNSSWIFANVPSTKSILLIDCKSNSVISSWRINNASSNFPIALDETNHRLFTGCRKPSAIIVYDTELMKEITRFDIKDDADDIFYDSVKKFLYISCGEGYLQVFKQENKDTYSLIQEVNTSKRARTCLFVPELKKLFVASPKNADNEAEIQVYNILN